MGDQLVNLNVGGHCFTTTRTTLQQAGGTLAAMFGGQVEPTLLKDREGRFFIDRDGTHFGKILNYLRDGSVPLPAAREVREELRAEASFYNLEGLLEEIDARTEAAVRTQQAASEALASLLVAAREAADESLAMSDNYARMGTTKQTELSLRMPALALQLQAATLRLVDAGVRSADLG